MPDLTAVIKQAAMQAVEASDPAGIMFGTVLGVAPLSVQIDQKTILPADFFLLTSAVKPHREHIVDQSGERTVLVNTSLRTGDKVLLLRQQGGQMYVILDRLEGAE